MRTKGQSEVHQLIRSQVSASSHMVGFDLPHVTNDMILRFMDVDFSLLPGQAASSKSKIGDDERVFLGVVSSLAGAGVPLLKGGKTDWECELPLGIDTINCKTKRQKLTR